MNINNSLRAVKLNEYNSGSRPKIMAIVLHDTAGAGTVGDAKYLAADADHRGISVDFVALRTGEIYKLNPDLTRFSTNHAGRNTHLRTLDGAQIPVGGPPVLNGNVNAHTIGIEISHKANPAQDSPLWPDEQIVAVAELCKDLCDKFALTREDITTHAKIITDGSRSDPREFPWTVFWAGFDGTADENAAPLVPSTAVYHEVVAGDTLWGLANTYQTTVEAIKALNNLNTPSTIINVGQRLLVKS